MSAIEYFETKRFLEEIALERGQYCYDYAKALESKLDIAREALNKIYEGDPEGVYAGHLAKAALARIDQ